MILVEILCREKITDKLIQLIYYGLDCACICTNILFYKLKLMEKYIFVFRGGSDFLIIAALCKLQTLKKSSE